MAELVARLIFACTLRAALCESSGVQTRLIFCNGCNYSTKGTPESSPLPAVRCFKPRAAQSNAKNKAGCRVFPANFDFAPGSASTGRMEPKHPRGPSQSLLAQVPLATLRESLFVSARASARERAQRVPTRAVKDAQDSHGPRSLVRSSPAPRSTPGVYPGAPRAASQAASEQAASHTTTV